MKKYTLLKIRGVCYIPTQFRIPMNLNQHEFKISKKTENYNNELHCTFYSKRIEYKYIHVLEAPVIWHSSDRQHTYPQVMHNKARSLQSSCDSNSRCGFRTGSNKLKRYYIYLWVAMFKWSGRTVPLPWDFTYEIRTVNSMNTCSPPKYPQEAMYKFPYIILTMYLLSVRIF